MTTIPTRIQSQLIVALDNLSLCDFLEECDGTFIPTELQMQGPHRRVVLPGENSGFITTPIVHAAILDIRRLLPFLGLFYSQKDNCFCAMHDTKCADDYWIGDLGIAPVSPDKFDALSKDCLGFGAVAILGDVLKYSNKQMAHFSKSEGLPGFDQLRFASRLLFDAVIIFVFDALRLPRPKLHFKNQS